MAGEATRWRDLATLIEGAPVEDIAAAVAAALLPPSSDEMDDSSRRGGGGRRESETGRCLWCKAALAAAADEDADGDAAVFVSGEKLPGARPWRPDAGAPVPCAGCIVERIGYRNNGGKRRGRWLHLAPGNGGHETVGKSQPIRRKKRSGCAAGPFARGQSVSSLAGRRRTIRAGCRVLEHDGTGSMMTIRICEERRESKR